MAAKKWTMLQATWDLVAKDATAFDAPPSWQHASADGSSAAKMRSLACGFDGQHRQIMEGLAAKPVEVKRVHFEECDEYNADGVSRTEVSSAGRSVAGAAGAGRADRLPASMHGYNTTQQAFLAEHTKAKVLARNSKLSSNPGNSKPSNSKPSSNSSNSKLSKPSSSKPSSSKPSKRVSNLLVPAEESKKLPTASTTKAAKRQACTTRSADAKRLATDDAPRGTSSREAATSSSSSWHAAYGVVKVKRHSFLADAIRLQVGMFPEDDKHLLSMTNHLEPAQPQQTSHQGHQGHQGHQVKDSDALGTSSSLVPRMDISRCDASKVADYLDVHATLVRLTSVRNARDLVASKHDVHFYAKDADNFHPLFQGVYRYVECDLHMQRSCKQMLLASSNRGGRLPWNHAPTFQLAPALLCGLSSNGDALLGQLEKALLEKNIGVLCLPGSSVWCWLPDDLGSWKLVPFLGKVVRVQSDASMLQLARVFTEDLVSTASSPRLLNFPSEDLTTEVTCSVRAASMLCVPRLPLTGDEGDFKVLVDPEELWEFASKPFVAERQEQAEGKGFCRH